MQKRSAKKGAMEASKKARASTKPADTKGSPEKGVRDTWGHKEDVDAFNVFTLDMDTVECPICLLPFDSQIYTCKNGHAACANCCVSMNQRCPSCNEHIGDSRCRAMEKVLAGMTRPCKYRKYGCCEVVKFTETRVHEEEACPYAPHSCPFGGCTYDGMLLYDHILDNHIQDDHATNVQVASGMGMLRGTRVTLQKGSPFHALLYPDGESVFVPVNCGDVPAGRSLAMVRVCPRRGPDEEDAEKVRYIMVVRGDEPGSLSLTASGTVQYVSRLEGYRPERFLFVPDAFWGSSGSTTVTVYV